MEDAARDRLESLPPSAKLVYYVLDEEGRLDQTGLASETRLSTRTVRFAVEKLTDADLVDEGLCPTDARRSVYAASPPTPEGGAESDDPADAASTTVAAED